MNDTTKAILEMLIDQINSTAYEYSIAKKRTFGEVFRHLNTVMVLLDCLLSKSCELAGVEYEHHEVETGDLAFEVYSIIYPAKTETLKSGDA